jgi:hypothetical protein
MSDTEKIIKRFKTETVTIEERVLEERVNPQTKKKQMVPAIKKVATEVTVILAADFNLLVQAVFNFQKKTQKYDVRLDLWGALQQSLDHLFRVTSEGLKTTKPAIDGFKSTGNSIGQVKFLLDHFVQEKLIAPGRYLIRFPADTLTPTSK